MRLSRFDEKGLSRNFTTFMIINIGAKLAKWIIDQWIMAVMMSTDVATPQWIYDKFRCIAMLIVPSQLRILSIVKLLASCLNDGVLCLIVSVGGTGLSYWEMNREGSCRNRVRDLKWLQEGYVSWVLTRLENTDFNKTMRTVNDRMFPAETKFFGSSSLGKRTQPHMKTPKSTASGSNDF